jgi:hypothetical protein
MKPAAERQQGASFDLHSGHSSVPDDQPCDLVSQQTINLATSCRSDKLSDLRYNKGLWASLNNLSPH